MCLFSVHARVRSRHGTHAASRWHKRISPRRCTRRAHSGTRMRDLSVPPSPSSLSLCSSHIANVSRGFLASLISLSLSLLSLSLFARLTSCLLSHARAHKHTLPFVRSLFVLLLLSVLSPSRRSLSFSFSPLFPPNSARPSLFLCRSASLSRALALPFSQVSSRSRRPSHSSALYPFALFTAQLSLSLPSHPLPLSFPLLSFLTAQRSLSLARALSLLFSAYTLRRRRVCAGQPVKWPLVWTEQDAA